MFLDDLITKMPETRLKLVNEAFDHLDINKNNHLELNEVKDRFCPNRHPDVLSRLMNTEEAKFEFYNLFTTMHSANNFFWDEKRVSRDDFIEYHSIVSTQIERDCEFRNFIIGVWNMDILDENMPPQQTRQTFNDPNLAGKRDIAFPAKNTHVAWKHDFHRS